MTTILELSAWAGALMLATTMALVARGFLPVAMRADGSPVYHRSGGVVLIVTASTLRAHYWDVMPLALDAMHEGSWSDWHAMVGRPIPNSILGLLFICGGRHLLVLFWLLIPNHARERYSFLTAPLLSPAPPPCAAPSLACWSAGGGDIAPPSHPLPPRHHAEFHGGTICRKTQSGRSIPD
ncbi:hypothetical protein [Paracoccus indicus]|uniref:hypothetical protein n=1 Tax=Paracoccus indicus TaxID=2079229 RepID=UPI0013B3A26E|nr:hypothetical protein [Paracoccus indicus]